MPEETMAVNHFAPDSSNQDEKGELLLLREARSGDSESFGALVRRYQDELYRLALGLVSSPHDAEDLVADAFVKAWRHLAGFKNESSFRTWLFRILINASRSHLRRRYLRRKLFFRDSAENNDGDDVLVQFADPSAENDPEKRSERASLRAAVTAAKRALSAREREAFTLKYEQDMKIREIAGLLSLSPNTVKVLLFRATKKMAAALK